MYEQLCDCNCYCLSLRHFFWQSNKCLLLHAGTIYILHIPHVANCISRCFTCYNSMFPWYIHDDKQPWTRSNEHNKYIIYSRSSCFTPHVANCINRCFTFYNTLLQMVICIQSATYKNKELSTIASIGRKKLEIVDLTSATP